jgi:hypothetical protein
MVVKLAKKLRAAADDAADKVSSPRQATERYRQIVRAKAIDGQEPDYDELSRLAFWIEGLTLAKYKTDVRGFNARTKGILAMRELDLACDGLDDKYEQFGRASAESYKALADHEDRWLALADLRDENEVVAKSDQQVLQTERQDARSAILKSGIGELGIGDSYPDCSAQVQKRLTLIERLPKLMEQLAKAEVHERRFQEVSRKLDEWKRGKFKPAMVDAAGRDRLPKWQQVKCGQWWGKLEPPTAANVAAAEKWLEQYRAAFMTVEQAQLQVDQCRQSIANVTAQIKERWAHFDQVHGSSRS